MPATRYGKMMPFLFLSAGLVACGGCPCARSGGEAAAVAGELPPPPRAAAWHPSERCGALAADYLSRMSLDEKAGQMTQAAIRYLSSVEEISRYHLGSVLAGGTDMPPGGRRAEHWAAYGDSVRAEALETRLGIPLLFGVDAVHGMGGAEGAVVFPHNIGLGASRDEDLIRRAARITALEAKGSGVDWAFAPVVAAARDERWGRTYEAFGETPALTGRLGGIAVLGLQDNTLGPNPTLLACAKHFAGDGATAFGTSHMPGGLLDRGNTLLNKRDFRRLAVDPFRPAIAAGVGSIMVSYSSVRGVKMHEAKHLLTAVLKEELGFNGFVVSDWMGIDDIPGDFKTDVASAINAGIDMVMVPDRYAAFINQLKSLAGSEVPMARIDDAVSRILTVKCEMGLFDEDHSPTTDPRLTALVGSDAHRRVAREAVRKSAVLLQNRGGVLPLNPEMKVHVTGWAADNLDPQCGGWTVTWMGSGSRTEGTTVRRAVENAVGADNVTFSEGTEVPEGTDAVVLVIGEPPYAEWKGDRADLDLSDGDVLALDAAAAAGVPVVVVLFSGRPLIITPHLDKAAAWIAAWLPGTEGDGIADLLFGAADFTGRLPHSWPRDMSQVPTNREDLSYAPLYPYGFGLSYKK